MFAGAAPPPGENVEDHNHRDRRDCRALASMILVVAARRHRLLALGMVNWRRMQPATKGKGSMACARLVLVITALAVSSGIASALDKIQVGETFLNGSPIFTQTGQVIDQQTCHNVVARNLTDAPGFGLCCSDDR
jgi:hypothetical protein